MSLVSVAKKLSERAKTLWIPRSAIESAQNDHTTVVHSILKNKAGKTKGRFAYAKSNMFSLR